MQALARLGKKPTLKVISATGPNAQHPSLNPPAPVHIPLHATLHLHHPDHLGSRTHVRCRILECRPQVPLTPSSMLSVFTFGLTKWALLLPYQPFYTTATRPSILTPYTPKLSGGSAGLIYSYLLSFLGSIAIFTTMAELASM